MSQVEAGPVSEKVIPLEEAVPAIREALLAMIREQPIDGPWAVVTQTSPVKLIFKGHGYQPDASIDLFPRFCPNSASLEVLRAIGTQEEERFHNIPSVPGFSESQVKGLLISPWMPHIRISAENNQITAKTINEGIDFSDICAKAYQLLADPGSSFEIHDLSGSDPWRDALNLLFPNRARRT